MGKSSFTPYTKYCVGLAFLILGDQN